MVLDLVAVAAGVPTAISGIGAGICTAEAVRQQNVLDEEAESDDRQAPFHLDVFCDAQSRKKDEVHDAMVVLREGKVRSLFSLTYTLTCKLSYK